MALPTVAVCARAQDAERREIVGRARAGHAAARIENPPGEPPFVRLQRPALAALQVDEGECRLLGLRHGGEPADPAEIGKRRPVAGEEQVVAVVDIEIDDGIVVGAAAAAGEFRRLVNGDGAARLRKLDGGGETGKAGADDVDDARHQAIPWRRTAPSTWSLLVLTRARGAAKPRARRSARIFR